MTSMGAQATGSGPDDALRRAVLSVVVPLQGAHLTGVPAAAARLARLRRALTSSPGSIPDVWSDTIGALPPGLLGREDAASAYELAAHAAVCLYAIHQQSQPVGMHCPQRNLGAGVQLLRRSRGGGEDADKAVLRRFHALATASSFSETLHHLRGLVTLLRSERVGLDYGQLAVDLRRLQQPSSTPGVRLTWGRGLYRRSSTHDSDATDGVDQPTSSESVTAPDNSGDDA